MLLITPMKSNFLTTCQALMLMSCGAFTTSTLTGQTLGEDFEDGSLAPFGLEVAAGNLAEIITPSGFAARAGSKVQHLKWFQANSDGTRATRSVEGTSGSANPRITGEGWYAFSFYLPANAPVPGKAMVLGQIDGWDASLPDTNITVTIGVEANGKLVLEGAYGVGDGGKATNVYTALAPVLATGSWHDVILHCKFSRASAGILTAWVDGAPETTPTVNYTGINLGNGAWSDDATLTTGACIKWGPDCWDSANFTAGESREVYYDEIAYQVGNPAGSFNLVKPAGYGAGYAVPAGGTIALTENFDAMASGAPPTGFTIASGAGTAATVANIPSASDRSLQLTDSNAATRVEAVKVFAAQTGRFTASWSFQQSGVGQDHRMALYSGNLPVIEFDTTGGNLVYRDSAAVDHILQAVPANAWYDVAVDVDLTTLKADVYVGGIRQLTQAIFRGDATMVDRIQFATSDVSAASDLCVNNILIQQAAPALVETFDTGITGAAPAGWGITNLTGTHPAVREVPGATDKSIQFDDATGAAEAFAAFVPLSSDFAVSWSFKQTGATDGHRMALQNGSSLAAVELLTTAAGNLVYRRPGTAAPLTLQALTPNVFYTVKVVVRPTPRQADIYVNDVLKLANQDLYTVVTAVDRIVFSTSALTPAVQLFVNDVTVDVNAVPPPAPMAANIPRLPVVLKLDDLNTSGSVPIAWKRVTDFAAARGIKLSAGLIAKSLETGNASYISYLQGLKASGMVELWCHGYDHNGPEFGAAYDYTVQKNHLVTAQSLAVSKLGFSFAGFGAPENSFTDTTVQVMSEDAAMKVWIYGDLTKTAGKTVLDRVGPVNIESPLFLPNAERFIQGYLNYYSNRQFYVIQGHPPNWTDARWVGFVKLIDYLAANNVPLTTPSELAAQLAAPEPDAAPTITTQPTNLLVATGASASFAVGATGLPLPTYQWYKGATAISGAVNASYTIATTVAGDAADYSVVVTNSLGAATSNTVTLTLTTASQNPTVLTWASATAGNWNTTTATAWTPGPVAVTPGTVAWNNANGDTANFTGGSYTLTNNNAGLSVGAFTVASGAAVTLFPGTSSTLTLVGATPSFSGAGTLWISIPVLGANGFTTSLNNLRFTTAASYTGNTSLTGGQLVLQGNNLLPATTLMTLSGSGTLSMQGNQSFAGLTGSSNTTIRNTVFTNNYTLNITGGTNTHAGKILQTNTGSLGLLNSGGTLTLSNSANTYAGTTTVSAGTLVAGASSLATSIAGLTPVTADNTTDIFTMATGNSLGNGTQVIFFATTIPTGLTASSVAYYVVNSAGSTFQVSATAGGSALNFTTNGTSVMVTQNLAGAFGSTNTAITLGDAATTTNNSSAALLTGGAFTIGRAVTIANQATTGTYTLGGNTTSASSFSGLVTTNRNLTVSQLAGGVLNLTGGITGASSGTKTLTFGNAGAVNVSTTGISDGATGNVAVTQAGAGTTTLAAANTYTGDTTVTAGTLAVTGSSIPDANKLVISGGTVNLTGAETVNSLYFGAVQKAAGTYSATGAGGTIASANFSGTGTLIVATGSVDPYPSWIDSPVFNSPALTAAQKLPGADPDGDSIPNLLEFAINGDPVSASDHGKIASVIQDASDPVSKELTLVVAVLDGAAFNSGATATVGGVTYTVQGSLDLAFPGATVSSTGPSDIAPAGSGLPSLAGTGWEYQTFKLNASEGLSGKGFLRLSVTQP